MAEPPSKQLKGPGHRGQTAGIESDDSRRPAPVQLSAITGEEMKVLGRKLGRAMRAGDVVGLTGPLGAGKTTLTQGIAEGLDVPRDRHVASPTYALVNEHPARVPFVHADFYRLRDQAELVELGLDETFEHAAVVIEWIDLFPAAVPADHLRVAIAITTDIASAGARVVTLRPMGARSAELAGEAFGGPDPAAQAHSD